MNTKEITKNRHTPLTGLRKDPHLETSLLTCGIFFTPDTPSALGLAHLEPLSG